MRQVDEVREAYFLAKLTAYAQGFSLMALASRKNNWQLDFSSIASIFRAGCIIQARLLEDLMILFEKEPNIENFLLSNSMLSIVEKNINNLRKLNIVFALKEIPNKSFSSALIYIDTLKGERIGANLIQAQRDYFGSHTFHRIDKSEAIHHEWKN